MTNVMETKVRKEVQEFAEMMIDRMEQLEKEQWNKPWLSPNGGFGGWPQNRSGREYNASNSFFLLLDTIKHGYKTPIYMTLMQASKEGMRINAGSKSMPIFFFDLYIKDEKGKRMEREKYDSLPQVEKEKCDVHSYIRFYRVFNIDQTNMKDVKPELYEKLTKGTQKQEIAPDTNGMYVHAALDRMFEKQEWVCPIHIERTDRAFYRPSTDEIHVPEKVQYARHRDSKEELYNDGMDYYANTLHEMAHSTGAASRLNRQNGRFGDPQYAKEELVAELTSALVCTHQGMSSRVSDESAKYLNSWIGTLKENPDFIMTVLTDVNKAARMINDKIGEQQRLLEGETVQASAHRRAARGCHKMGSLSQERVWRLVCRHGRQGH